VDPAEFVLQRPTPGERPVLEGAVERAARGVVLWITKGIQAAMRHCNVRAAGGAGREDRTHDGATTTQEDFHAQ
jgi:hypothetical protein